MSGFEITYEVTAQRLSQNEIRVIHVTNDNSDPHKKYETPHLHIDGMDIHNVVLRSTPTGNDTAEVKVTGGSEFGLADEIAQALKPLVESYGGLYAKASPRKGEPSYKRQTISIEVTHISEGAFLLP